MSAAPAGAEPVGIGGVVGCAGALGPAAQAKLPTPTISMAPNIETVAFMAVPPNALTPRN